jgi:hypothetical protein
VGLRLKVLQQHVEQRLDGDVGEHRVAHPRALDELILVATPDLALADVARVQQVAEQSLRLPLTEADRLCDLTCRAGRVPRQL